MFNLAEFIVAVIWGIVAIVLLLAFAVAQGSLYGGALAVIAAGAVYVYQATLCELDDEDRVQHYVALRCLQVFPLLLGIASLTAILLGA
jgi:hypothetical protein